MIVFKEPLKTVQLDADDDGIRFHERGGLGTGETAQHPFRAIDAVVRSTDNAAQPMLSIQVGSSIYSIRYKPSDEKHRAVIDRIVTGARKSMEEPS